MMTEWGEHRSRSASDPRRVSIIIVTYQSEAFISPCLDSVAEHAGLAVEVIVVDNGSTDATLERVRERPQPVRLIPFPSNRGFAAAANAGAAVANGDSLLLLNPDARLLPGTLPTLARFLDEHPTVAAAGPRLVYPDGHPQDSAFRYPTLLMTWLEFFPRPARLLHTRWNGRLSGQGAEPIEIDHPLGACMLVRRAAWDAVGPLDEGFFLYCEELDWCMRAKALGWKIMHVPAATAVHQGGGSADQHPASLLHLYQSRRRLHRKHRSWWFRSLAALITRIGLQAERRRLARRQAGLASPDRLAQERLQTIDRILRGALA